MEKTRVPKGEKYWYIFLTYGEVEVNRKYELLNCFDNERFHNGNYFHTDKEAESIARKLRAVLNGADVIEMPSEEEIKASQDRIEDEVVFNIRDVNGSQLIYCIAINKGAELMAEWFKNKIVK